MKYKCALYLGLNLNQKMSMSSVASLNKDLYFVFIFNSTTQGVDPANAQQRKLIMEGEKLYLSSHQNEDVVVKDSMYVYVIPAHSPHTKYIRTRGSRINCTVLICLKTNVWKAQNISHLREDPMPDQYDSEHFDVFIAFVRSGKEKWISAGDGLLQIIMAGEIRINRTGKTTGTVINNTEYQYIIEKNNPLKRYVIDKKTKTCHFVAIVPKVKVWHTRDND